MPPFLPLHTIIPGPGQQIGVDLTAEVLPASLTAGSIAPGAIGTPQIAPNSITSAQIAPGAVVSANVAANLIQTVSVPLSFAQIRGMFAAPVTLLAAPGAGKSYELFAVLFRMTTTGVAYMNGGAVVLQYHTGAVAATNTIPAATITAAAGTSDTILQGIDAAIGAQNDTIEITNATAAFTAGTGTAVVTLWYAIA